MADHVQLDLGVGLQVGGDLIERRLGFGLDVGFAGIEVNAVDGDLAVRGDGFLDLVGSDDDHLLLHRLGLHDVHRQIGALFGLVGLIRLGPADGDQSHRDVAFLEGAGAQVVGWARVHHVLRADVLDEILLPGGVGGQEVVPRARLGILGGVVQRLEAVAGKLVDVVAVDLQRTRAARGLVPQAGELAFQVQRRLGIDALVGLEIQLLEGGGLEIHLVEIAHFVADDGAALKALEAGVVLGTRHVLRDGGARQNAHDSQRYQPCSNPLLDFHDPPLSMKR